MREGRGWGGSWSSLTASAGERVLGETVLGENGVSQTTHDRSSSACSLVSDGQAFWGCGSDTACSGPLRCQPAVRSLRAQAPINNTSWVPRQPLGPHVCSPPRVRLSLNTSQPPLPLCLDSTQPPCKCHLLCVPLDLLGTNSCSEPSHLVARV